MHSFLVFQKQRISPLFCQLKSSIIQTGSHSKPSYFSHGNVSGILLLLNRLLRSLPNVWQVGLRQVCLLKHLAGAWWPSDSIRTVWIVSPPWLKFHVIGVSFITPLCSSNAWVRITICQTWNHRITDVQYIAHKTTVLPDPVKTPWVSLSKLGFGDPTQKFVVCWIFLFLWTFPAWYRIS